MILFPKLIHSKHQTPTPTGTSTAPVTSTKESDEVIHVELDPDLKEYIRVS